MANRAIMKTFLAQKRLLNSDFEHETFSRHKHLNFGV